MRITKVALAFFSIGFLAGSFERAAGLGHSEVSRAAQDRAVGTAVMRNTVTVMASVGSFGGLPDELFAPSVLPPNDTPPAVSLGLSEAIEADRAQLVPSPIVYAPELPPELSPPATAVAPVQRRRFGVARVSSEPERMALSRMPPPVSLPGPFDDLPPKSKAAPEREPETPLARGPEFIMPFERGRVTSLFHQGRYHPAIDLAGALGSRVHATTRRQRVTYAGWQNGYGNVVVTRDDTGRVHLYGHLQRVMAKVGAILDQGQMLGTLGSTGHSTGPHVHYELKTRAGAHMDPVTFLFGRRVGRGYAWNGSRSVTRLASRTTGQPRPR